MQSQVACCLPCWTRYTLPYKRQRTRTFVHWHRHSAWISAIVLSVASWRKKKRSCGSDKSAHDLGRDKSKNAFILRKYGSICMGGKTKDYCRVLSRISRSMIGLSLTCSAVIPCFSISSRNFGYFLNSFFKSFIIEFRYFGLPLTNL